MYETNHALNYDCQQMYLKNRYMHSKPMVGAAGNSVTTPAGYGTGQPISTPDHLRHQHQPQHHQPHPEAVGAYGGYATMEDLGLGPRSFALDESLKDKSLRDYLTSWSEMEEEDGGGAAAAAAKAPKETNNNLIAHQNYESCKYGGQLQQQPQQQTFDTSVQVTAPEDVPVTTQQALTAEPEVQTEKDIPVEAES